jgi:hypothetical protein
MDLEQAASLSAPAAGHTRFGANDDGTLRYYPDGGSELTVSDTTHTHTQASGSQNNARLSVTHDLLSTTYTDTTGFTATPSDSTGSSQYAIVHFGYGAWRNVTGSSGTVHLRLLKGGVQQVETSIAIGSAVESAVSLETSTVYIAEAASSTNFAVEQKKSGTHSTVTTYGLGTVTREIQCL